MRAWRCARVGLSWEGSGREGRRGCLSAGQRHDEKGSGAPVAVVDLVEEVIRDGGQVVAQQDHVPLGWACAIAHRKRADLQTKKSSSFRQQAHESALRVDALEWTDHPMSTFGCMEECRESRSLLGMSACLCLYAFVAHRLRIGTFVNYMQIHAALFWYAWRLQW